MATFRTMSPALWSDPFIEDLSAQEKLLYIYLFTNEHVNNVGYMQATMRKISFETAVPQEGVASFLEKTDRLGKTVRDGDAILCLNFIRYQTTKSPQIAKNLRKVFGTVGSAKLRQALAERYPDIFKHVDDDQMPHKDGSDTPSIPYQDSMDDTPITPRDGSDTLAIQRQDRTVHSRIKKDPEHTHDGSHDFQTTDCRSGVCVSPAPLSGEDLADRQEGARQERQRGDYEFSLLRDAYDKARQEGQLSGRQEFLRLYHSPDWPGIDELIASVERLLAQDDQWRRGFAPGLARFLSEKLWTMKPRAPAGEREPEPTPEKEAFKRKDAEVRRRLEEKLAKAKGGRRG